MAPTITAGTSRQQMQQFERAMRDIGQAHIRGMAFALNGVAKDAQRRVVEGLPKVIDQPNAFTMRGIGVTFIPLNSTEIEGKGSELFVRPDQSAYFKYLMGDAGQNVRQPGDIGPADKHIYVPLWRNLRRAGIRQINGGSLPRSTLKKLLASKTKRSPYFFGAPKFGGQQHGLGIWMRPTRVHVNGHTVNSGKPIMLVRAADKATYKPILQPLWNRSATEAMATLGTRLQTELDKKIAHLAAKRAG